MSDAAIPVEVETVDLTITVDETTARGIQEAADSFADGDAGRIVMAVWSDFEARQKKREALLTFAATPVQF